MAGLGILLYGALRAICGIGQAVDNSQMKRNHLVIQIKENQPI